MGWEETGRGLELEARGWDAGRWRLAWTYRGNRVGSVGGEGQRIRVDKVRVSKDGSDDFD